MSNEQTTDHFTRKEVNTAAKRLAANLRNFTRDADQFLSAQRKYDLLYAVDSLENLANGQ